jgi:hypothetical protein
MALPATDGAGMVLKPLIGFLHGVSGIFDLPFPRGTISGWWLTFEISPVDINAAGFGFAIL